MSLLFTVLLADKYSWHWKANMGRKEDNRMPKRKILCRSSERRNVGRSERR
jgi:hypothetical protein